MGSFTRGGAGDINEDRCIKGAWEFRAARDGFGAVRGVPEGGPGGITRQYQVEGMGEVPPFDVDMNGRYHAENCAQAIGCPRGGRREVAKLVGGVESVGHVVALLGIGRESARLYAR